MAKGGIRNEKDVERKENMIFITSASRFLNLAEPNLTSYE